MTEPPDACRQEPTGSSPARGKGVRAALGFRDGDKGTHSSRTLMLIELEQLLAATPPEAVMTDFRRVVVDENVLGKRSATTREHTVRKLKALYGLDPAIPVYRVMRQLWTDDAEGHPLLALMCGVARDPLLRESVAAVSDVSLGMEVTHEQLAATVRSSFSVATRDAIISHLMSTWTMGGFLSESAAKVRVRAKATPGAATYALVLGYLEGGRGSLLLSTRWTKLLDRTPDEVLSLVQQAARRGWVQYRAAGDVQEIRLDGWLTDEEKGWCHGQPG